MDYTYDDFVKTCRSPGGVARVDHPSWLLKGCPKCGCKTWQVTSDSWAYCDGCYKGYSTAYPFTSGELVEDFPAKGSADV